MSWVPLRTRCQERQCRYFAAAVFDLWVFLYIELWLVLLIGLILDLGSRGGVSGEFRQLAEVIGNKYRSYIQPF